MSNENIVEFSSKVERAAALEFLRPTRAYRPGSEVFALPTADDPDDTRYIFNDVDPTLAPARMVMPYHTGGSRVLAVVAPPVMLTDRRPEDIPEPNVLCVSPSGEAALGIWRLRDPIYDQRVIDRIASRLGGEAVPEHCYTPLRGVVRVTTDHVYDVPQVSLPGPIGDLTIVELDWDSLGKRFPSVSPEVWAALETDGNATTPLGKDHRDLSRSGTEFFCMKALAGAGVSDNEIYSIWRQHPIGAYLRENDRQFDGAFRRELTRIRNSLAVASVQKVLVPTQPRADGDGALVPLPSPMPRRQVLVPGIAYNGLVTMITGKGGEGKSLFTLQLATAVAAGVPFAHWTPTRSEKVLYINIEDDMLETQRRLAAICQTMSIAPEALAGRLYKWSVPRIELIEKDPDSGDIFATKLHGELMEKVRAEGFGLVVIDPLLETHKGLDENSNSDMKELIIAIRTLAFVNRVPYIIVHHSRKNSTPGDQDSARGGSALVNACRVVKTMERMSADESAAAPIGEHPRERFVKVTDAKQNYSARSGDLWVRIETVTLENGEDVPAFVAANLDGVGPENFTDWAGLANLVARGAPDGKPWRDKGSKANRLDHAVMGAFKVKEKTAIELIALAVKDGHIVRVLGKTSKNKTATVVYVLAKDAPAIEEQNEIQF